MFSRKTYKVFQFFSIAVLCNVSFINVYFLSFFEKLDVLIMVRDLSDLPQKKLKMPSFSYLPLPQKKNLGPRERIWNSMVTQFPVWRIPFPFFDEKIIWPKFSKMWFPHLNRNHIPLSRHFPAFFFWSKKLYNNVCVCVCVFGEGGGILNIEVSLEKLIKFNKKQKKKDSVFQRFWNIFFWKRSYDFFKLR